MRGRLASRRNPPLRMKIDGDLYRVLGVRRDGTYIVQRTDESRPKKSLAFRRVAFYEDKTQRIYDPRTKRFVNPGNGGDEEARAASISQMWHGREPRELIEDSDELVVPTVFAELGKLVEIEFENEKGAFVIEGFDRKVSLAAGVNGTQLYVVGRVPISDGELVEFTSEYEAKRDKVHLGEATRVVYETDKHHLEDTGGEIVEYEHEFGEEGGELPTLVYDKLNESLELVGGDYRIEDRGIVD